MNEASSPARDPRAAVIVCLDFGGEGYEEGIEEIVRLVESAGVVRHRVVRGRRQRPDAKFFCGRGKAAEIARAAEELNAAFVVFNHELSPAQQRNLEGALQVKVIEVDRSRNRLDPKTGQVERIPLGEGSAPHGVVIGPDGAAWVTGGQPLVKRLPELEVLADPRQAQAVVRGRLVLVRRHRPERPAGKVLPELRRAGEEEQPAQGHVVKGQKSTRCADKLLAAPAGPNIFVGATQCA